MARKALNAAGGFVGRHAALAWAVATALLIEALVPVWWWHPACAIGDGPTEYAFGFPLPYGEASIVSSLEWHVMPHVWLLNVALIAGVLFGGLYFAQRRLPPLWRTVAGAVGLTALVLVAAVWTLWFVSCTRPTWSIADSLVDRTLLSYRPAFLAEADGVAPCRR